MTTSVELMTFMVEFKRTMEISMEAVRKDIDEQIDTKLQDIGKGMENLGEKLKASEEKLEDRLKMSEEKQEEENKKLGHRLQRMEEDMRRMKHSKMQSESLVVKSARQQGRGQIFRLEEEEEKTTGGEKTKTMLPEPGKEDEPRLVRSNSWAEEVDKEIQVVKQVEGISEELKRKMEDDRRQWTGARRSPSEWAKEWEREVDMAGRQGDREWRVKAKEKEERERERERKNEKEDRYAGRRSRRDNDQHTCGGKALKLRHWFGESDISSDSSEEEGNWTQIDRERKRKEKTRKTKERRKERKAEVAKKARNMAGNRTHY